MVFLSKVVSCACLPQDLLLTATLGTLLKATLLTSLRELLQKEKPASLARVESLS